jgi:outer membrane immunogenic protein
MESTMDVQRVFCRSAVSMAFVLLLAMPVLAADLSLPMPVKAPQIAAPPPIHDWSGFYVGVHAGYGWDPASGTFDPTAYATALLPTIAITTATPAFGLSVNPQGGLGGLQAGYNWQNGIWVYGLEADVSWSRIKDEATKAFLVTATNDVNDATLDASFTGNVRLKQELDYFGTVRGRIGWAADTLLLFGTGGLGWGHVKTTFETFNLATSTGANSILSTARSTSSDKTRLGFAVGGGAEWGFVPTWSLKAEYLYTGLGQGDKLTLPGGTADSEFHMHVVRAGLNHNFSAH